MLILKKTLIFLFLIFPFVLYSQTKEIDSIRNEITSTTIDTVKINSLNLLGEKLLRYNLDNALDTLDLSVKLAKKVQFKKGLAKAFKNLGVVFYYKGQVDSSLQYFTIGKEIYEENGFLIDAGKMANNIGIVKGKLGDLTGAIKSYLEAIELLKQANEYRPLITTYINVSNTYRNIGNYQEALNLDFKALETFKNLTDISQDDSLNIGHIYKSIANIYTSQKSYKQAELTYLKALKIYEKYKSLNDVGDIYLNIGFLYGSNDNDNKYDTIIGFKKYINFQAFVHHYINKERRKNDTIAERENYLKALQYYTIKDKIALANLNLGDSYKKSGMYDSSHYHLNIALKIYSELGDKRGIILVYNSFGEYYNKIEKYSEAIEVLKAALDTAKHIGDIKIISSLSNSLFGSYKSIGNYKEALVMHELYKKMQDSIFNTDNEKKLTQMSLSFEFEKEQEQAQIKYNEELKRQRIIKYFTFAVLFLMVLGLLAIFSAFRTKKKKNEELNIKNAEITQQKEEIEAQRDEIETQLEQIEIQRNQLESKNHDIEASIHYALRIQKAILPNLNIFDKYFSDSFVYYKPRDIVSGDFYWATEKDNKFFVVAADCTGHGVPGAFMSMLGVSFLNQIVISDNTIDSQEILTELRKMVISSLKQSVEDEDSTKDGMDLSLIVYDKEKLEIQYSGSYNSIYIISEDKPEILRGEDNIRKFELENIEPKIFELKADRMPIGIFVLKSGEFNKMTVKVKPNDRIYMFSDGFPDLFNKGNRQKFTSKRFKKLFLENSDAVIASQHELLERTFEMWVDGDKQIDDILVIGLEI